MLQLTLDVFSGRKNPTSFVDDAESREILQELSLNRNIISAVDSGYQGLGFRGIIIELMDDTIGERFGLPTSMRIAGGASLNEAKAQEIGERLMRKLFDSVGYQNMSLPLEFERTVLDMLGHTQNTDHDSVDDIDDTAPGVIPAPAVTCKIESASYNPGFWNDPAHISKNNCYNYASNKRTDTFAQPGRGSGHPIASKDCAAVDAAALADGLHHRYDCLPDSEKPRWLVALVVAPGLDYHWYRKHKEGFWGHKRGTSVARNVDNKGVVVTDPRTCSRAPYTDFCGFFYVPKSQNIK